jgi:hypothetical protein
MPDQSTPRLRTFLPVLVPIAVSLVGTGWILHMAGEASENARCGLDLPWDTTRSFEILRSHYPAAWREVETLRRISSNCIAELHADIVSGYVIIVFLSLVCGVLSTPFTAFMRPRTAASDEQAYMRMTIALFLGAILFAYTLYMAANHLELINFDGSRRRISVRFSNGYVNVLSYWMAFQLLSVLGALALWFGCVGIVTLGQGLLKENQMESQLPTTEDMSQNSAIDDSVRHETRPEGSGGEDRGALEEPEDRLPQGSLRDLRAAP